MMGSQVTLDCAASGTTPRVQFWEYVTQFPAGTQISDAQDLLGSHPNHDDYTLTYDLDRQTYNLTINADPEDGGLYECRDMNMGQTGKYAEVVVIDRTPNCTTTLPSDGVVVEGEYYTIECQTYFWTTNPDIAPRLTWTGPGTYTQAYVRANGSAWAGASFHVNKTMDGGKFVCLINFKEEDFAGDEDTATNAPTWTYTYNGVVMFVQYGPQNVSYSPVLPSYEIGQVLTCNSIAVPLPTYKWTDMNTLTDYHSQTLTLTEVMVGELMLRCQVVNSVSSYNLFVNITVKPRTTLTPTPTTPSTSTVAPVARCDDLTGRWEATRSPTSTIVICLNVDTSDNGLIRGLLQNDTNEPYMTELIGRTRNYEYDESGWTGIWPELIGVSSHAAECHKCWGVEVMQVTLISRSSLDSNFCDGGETTTSDQFTFTRKPVSFPCSTSVAEMKANLEAANAPLRKRRLH